ncbi:MAG: OmpA family protein [Desulfobacterales bacterium]|jgi:outer membrane protein OmpA-like peptidoglycan-associated protein|nr:OmpA family protein [Desulfobacterales bacterium]
MKTGKPNFKTVSTILMIVCFMGTLSCASWEGASKETKGTIIGTGAGAAVGAGLGAALGGNTKSTLAGAGIGALVGGIAGNRLGAYMDEQDQKLQAIAAQSDAMSYQRSQNVLTATFKSDLMFDLNSATIKPGAYADLDRVATVLRDYPDTRIQVAGHTDKTGSETYNQELSERRAMAVKSALIQRGVADYRIDTIGFGESMPISSEDAINRRVEIRITPVQQG